MLWVLQIREQNLPQFRTALIQRNFQSWFQYLVDHVQGKHSNYQAGPNSKLKPLSDYIPIQKPPSSLVFFAASRFLSHRSWQCPWSLHFLSTGTRRVRSAGEAADGAGMDQAVMTSSGSRTDPTDPTSWVFPPLNSDVSSFFLWKSW